MTPDERKMRAYSKKPKRYLVWSDHDPNDSFEVEAENTDGAAWAALAELRWSVSAEPLRKPK